MFIGYFIKKARLSALFVGSIFRLHIRKERPILHMWLTWFVFITLKTTSIKKKPKEPLSLSDEKVLKNIDVGSPKFGRLDGI